MNLNIKKINFDYGDTIFTIYGFEDKRVDEEREDVSLLHCHEWYELHFLRSGEYEFNVENERIPMRAKDFLVINPKTEHYSYGISNSDFFTVSFEIKRKGKESNHYNYFKNTLDSVNKKRMKASGEMILLMNKIFSLPGEESIKKFCQLKCLYTKLFYELFDSVNGFCEKDGKSKETEIDYKITLDLMVNSPVYSLSDISESIGYSKRHTARLIKSIYKESLSDMRERRAFEKAKKLLEETTLSIEAVTTESGFESSTVMRYAFKKREGITPLEFKRNRLLKRTDF